ncbi:related to longevity-assurance protein LAG1 [Cephalotrichum gorgonifer]|uniref:Related to longevity-assurance protein LAG1 n=1 Tax=Cephalotrichum gorgonifer TaxID=2041049 RepID=A0AAE8SVP2_9PEZI|nr:related to longevity-assurance protein LAG1 [Cephalotrichum gorgonifer]
MAANEPFPILNTSADQLHTSPGNGPRRRRRSSLLADRNGEAKAPNDHSQTEPPPIRLSKRSLSIFRLAISRHPSLLPFLIVCAVLATYGLNPTPSNPVHPLIFVSYPGDLVDPATNPQAAGSRLYDKGLLDLVLVSFYVVVLSFTREFFMNEVFRPLSRRLGLPRSKQARFMEQMYTALYFGLSGPAGLYVMSRTPVWYFDPRGMYEGYPHRLQPGVVKFYYLFQAAYWAQQALVLVLGMEKPRKDFKELVAHHIVTLALIGASYRFHFTYMGLGVYLTHDISDFFLATSKMLKYLDSPILAPYYAVFMACWIYMRHYLNLLIIRSLFYEFKTVGPYILDWEAQAYKCDYAFFITLFLLCALQGLNLFWLVYIVRIAWRFLRYSEAEDERSEGEEEEEEEEKEEGDCLDVGVEK